MSNFEKKKGAQKVVPKSNRKKPGKSKEASKMGGVSQMSSGAAPSSGTAPASKNTTSQALSVSSQNGKSSKSKRAKKKIPPPKKGAAGPSRMESVASKVEDEEDEAPKPKPPKKEIPTQKFETAGKIKLRMLEHLRNPPNYGEFFVEDEKETRYVLRFEPAKRGKLHFTNEIIVETAKLFPANEKLPVLKSFEFSNSEKLAANYLLTSAYSLQVYELWKLAGYVFTPACVFNIALQAIDAIQYMHQAGFIHRNIKPATFNIGFGDNEHRIMLTDFRLARAHIDQKTKKVRAARPSVKYGGTSRYASIAALKEQEQGRKDDLESWIYMFYEMLDLENGLSWRKSGMCNMMIKEKENFKAHLLPNTYKKVPTEFKKLVDMVHAMSYESVPDYPAFKEIVESVAKSKNLDLKTYDWAGKVNPTIIANGIKLGNDKSTGNQCAGNDDFEFKKMVRKKMNPDDLIKNGSFTWKVVNLLGSGGFGDVYKVYDIKEKPGNKAKNQQHYALKTESEEGKKVMLRLKVEMQVLMAIQEDRKTPRELNENQHRREANAHFVEFVDRGRSEDLQCKFIVMSLVGPSLDDIRKKYGVKLEKGNSPFQIAMQSLEAIADLHHLGYLHRDIKPANFAVGFGPAEHTIFMLDFGIGRSFLDPATKKLRAPRKSVKFLGTLRYASRACMRSTDQGRRDDLECWIYMVYDIMDPKTGLFWKNIKKRDEILASKDALFAGKVKEREETELSPDVPKGMRQLIDYINNLRYQSAPNYAFMLNRILQVGSDEGYPEQKIRMKGGWVGQLNEKAKEKHPRFGDSDSDEKDSLTSEED